jgi:hypothetical protein
MAMIHHRGIRRNASSNSAASVIPENRSKIVHNFTIKLGGCLLRFVVFHFLVGDRYKLTGGPVTAGYPIAAQWEPSPSVPPRFLYFILASLECGKARLSLCTNTL